MLGRYRSVGQLTALNCVLQVLGQFLHFETWGTGTKSAGKARSIYRKRVLTISQTCFPDRPRELRTRHNPSSLQRRLGCRSRQRAGENKPGRDYQPAQRRGPPLHDQFS